MSVLPTHLNVSLPLSNGLARARKKTRPPAVVCECWNDMFSSLFIYPAHLLMSWTFFKSWWTGKRAKKGVTFAEFVAVISSFKEIPLKPSEPSSSHPETMFYRSRCLSGTALNRLKRNFFECYDSGKVSNKLFGYSLVLRAVVGNVSKPCQYSTRSLITLRSRKNRGKFPAWNISFIRALASVKCRHNP